jgi:hypothetical protein
MKTALQWMLQLVELIEGRAVSSGLCFCLFPEKSLNLPRSASLSAFAGMTRGRPES